MGALSTTINEKQCLHHLLDNPDSVLELSQNYFLTSEGYDLYEALVELYRRNIPFSDDHVLVEGNRRNNKINAELLNSVRNTPVENGSWNYCRSILKEDFAKNRIEDVILKQALEEVSRKSRLDVEKLQNIFYDMQYALSLISGEDAVIKNLNDMFNSYEHVLNKRLMGQEFYTTGCSFLDKILTVGFAPGEITTIFGSTGVGKTTVKSYLVNRLINRNIPCLDINLEMSETAIMDRLMAMRLKIPIRDLIPHTPTEREESNVLDMVKLEREHLQSSKKFAFIDDPVLDCLKLEKLIEQTKKMLKTDYLIVFIDLASMMKEFSGEDPKGYEKGMDRISQLAKRLKCHFVLVVQANQKTLEAHRPATLNGLGVFRPSLVNVKNAGGIAERSRTVLSVFREKYYATRFFPDDEDVANLDDVVEVQCLKQNNGVVGKKLSYLHIEGQFRLMPIADTSELRTVENLRRDRTEAQRRDENEEEEPQNYSVDPIITDRETNALNQAEQIMNGSPRPRREFR